MSLKNQVNGKFINNENSFLSSKHNDNKQFLHLKIDNIEIMTGDKTDGFNPFLVDAE